MTALRSVEPIYTRMCDVKRVFGISKSTAYRWKDEGLIEVRKFRGLAFVETARVRAVMEGAS